MSVVIRPITEADIEGCARVVASLPRFFGMEDNTRRLAAHVTGSTGGLVALSPHSDVLGFVTWRRHEEDAAAEITWMAVHGKLRHKGVGTDLLGRAEAVLRAQGCHSVTLLTSATSHTYEPTRRFYTARGYLPILRLPNLWPTDTVLVLSKQLLSPAPQWIEGETAHAGRGASDHGIAPPERRQSRYGEARSGPIAGR